jgi:hypothetical protein
MSHTCPDCPFTARSGRGLAMHRKTHTREPREGACGEFAEPRAVKGEVEGFEDGGVFSLGDVA